MTGEELELRILENNTSYRTLEEDRRSYHAPSVIGDLPVWLFALLHGNAAYFIFELCRYASVITAFMDSVDSEEVEEQIAFNTILSIPLVTKDGRRIRDLVRIVDRSDSTFTTKFERITGLVL